MTGTAALAKKAEQCINFRAKIPGAPLWHMGRAAKFGSADDLRTLQEAVDFLTCKAKAKLPFSEDEKEFLREVLEAFWWGGHYKGLHEAARLADHYVNGGGKRTSISAEAYTQSVIVQDTMAAVRDHIRDLIAEGRAFRLVKSTDAAFRKSLHFRQVTKHATPPRQAGAQGWVWPSGVLLAEQDNLRLKKADHQFVLVAESVLGRGGVVTAWSVTSLYDFESFDSKDYVTSIPLAKNLNLKIPDGLLHYMTVIGAAKEFWHTATWRETWAR